MSFWILVSGICFFVVLSKDASTEHSDPPPAGMDQNPALPGRIPNFEIAKKLGDTAFEPVTSRV